MAWVQGPIPNSVSAASNAKAFASSTPVGNLMVAVVTQLFGGNPPRAISSIADSVDSANFTLAKVLQDAGNTIQVAIYYRIATSAGTRTVTASFTGGSADSCIAINEYDSTHTILSASTSSAEGTGTSSTAGSITAAGTALYVNALTDANGVVITPTGGWSQRQEVESSSIAPISVQDLITSGAQNPATTLGASPGTWVNAIVAFESGASSKKLTLLGVG